MTRTLTIVPGLIAGVLAGITLLLLNPLPQFAALGPVSGGTRSVLSYRFDEARGSGLDALDLLGFADLGSISANDDAANRYAHAGIINLVAADGRTAALGIRISVASPTNSLLRGRLGTDDYWNIVWPGEGALFATRSASFWDAARDGFFGALQGNARAALAARYETSIPAQSGAFAGVVGTAGRYAGMGGDVRSVWLPQELRGPDWQLEIALTPASTR